MADDEDNKAAPPQWIRKLFAIHANWILKDNIVPAATVPSFSTTYIKSAWQGKAGAGGLIVFGFITKFILDFLFKTPVLQIPVTILAMIYSVWFFVSLWRCALNGERKWIGWLARIIFVVVPIITCLVLLGLYAWSIHEYIQQQVKIGNECVADRFDYLTAISGKAGSEYISDKKAALDVCNAHYAPCQSDPKKCIK